MIKRSLRSIAATWIAGLLVLLPLALALLVLAWVVGVVNGFLGPSSIVGRFFGPLGYPFSTNPGLAYVFGTLLVIALIDVLGLVVRSGPQGPLPKLTAVYVSMGITPPPPRLRAPACVTALP